MQYEKFIVHKTHYDYLFFLVNNMVHCVIIYFVYKQSQVYHSGTASDLFPGLSILTCVFRDSSSGSSQHVTNFTPH